MYNINPFTPIVSHTALKLLNLLCLKVKVQSRLFLYFHAMKSRCYQFLRKLMVTLATFCSERVKFIYQFIHSDYLSYIFSHSLSFSSIHVYISLQSRAARKLLLNFKKDGYPALLGVMLKAPWFKDLQKFAAPFHQHL